MDAIYKQQLRLLIEDPIIRKQLTVDGVTAGTIKVEENGDITLGRSSKGWVNFLFQSRFRIGFYELASKIAGIYIGKLNNAHMVGALEEIYKRCAEETNKEKTINIGREEIIDMLFMYAKLFVYGSVLKSRYIKDEDLDGFAKDPRLRRDRYGGNAFINLGGQSMPIILSADFFDK